MKRLPMSRNSFFILYFLAILLHSGAYGMILLMPVLLQEIGGSEADAGQLQLIAGISTIGIVLLSGKIVDKFGRMGSFAFSGLLLFLGLGSYGFLTEIGLLSVMASLLFGAGWGLFFSTKTMVLSQICRPEERVKLFSIDLVVFMIGFGMSPVAGRYLHGFGFSYAQVYWVMGGVCLLNSLLFMGLKPRLNQMRRVGNLNTKMMLSIPTLMQVFKSHSIIPIMITLLMASIYVGLNNFQAKWATLNGLDYADFFVAYTLAVLASRFGMMGYKITNKSYFHLCGLLGLGIVGAIGMLHMDGSWMIYMIAACLGGFGIGGMTPILQSITANQADPENLAQTMQIMVLAHLIGLFGYPFIGGLLIVESGFDLFHQGIILLCGLGVSLCVIGHVSFKKKKQA